MDSALSALDWELPLTTSRSILASHARIRLCSAGTRLLTLDILMSEPRRASLAVLFLTVFIDLLGFGIVLPLLPIYARDFTPLGWQKGLVIGLLMSSFSAMQFLFSPLWGRLSDRIGRRPVLLVGLAGSVVFYGLFGLATVYKNLTLLFVARIGAGIAGATIATAQAYIADATPLDKRHKGMALIGAAFGLGFTLGPLVGLLAVISGEGSPGYWPGVFASGLSLVALLLAVFKLPESLRPDSAPAARSWFGFGSLREALAAPSVGLLILASFICVFAFGGFESTLSLLVKGQTEEGRVFQTPFQFSFSKVCWTFAFIGFVLTLVQGGLVRRLSGRISEGAMGAGGAVLEVAGFGLLIFAIAQKSEGILFAALALVVSGFALMTPSINSLISRRSDPAQQGGILGLAQSVSSLARIAGPLAALVLFERDVTLPYWLAIGLMLLGGLMVVAAAATGKDFAARKPSKPPAF